MARRVPVSDIAIVHYKPKPGKTIAKKSALKNLKQYECGPFRYPDEAARNGHDRHVVFENHFSRDEPGIFEPIRETFLSGDRFMHLADLKSYSQAQRRLSELSAHPSARQRRTCMV